MPGLGEVEPGWGSSRWLRLPNLSGEAHAAMLASSNLQIVVLTVVTALHARVDGTQARCVERRWLLWQGLKIF